MACIWVEVNLNTEELAETISNQLSKDEIVELIKDIDSRMGDSVFTMEMKEYFSKKG